MRMRNLLRTNDGKRVLPAYSPATYRGRHLSCDARNGAVTVAIRSWNVAAGKVVVQRACARTANIALSPRKQILGAPHLARFSRDVGHHERRSLASREWIEGLGRGED